MKILMGERIFAASAYILGIPALYIVLTESERKKYLSYHSQQALLLWVLFFTLFFSLRFLIDLVWNKRFIAQFEGVEIFALFLMTLYALFCGYRAFMGTYFKIPR